MKEPLVLPSRKKGLVPSRFQIEEENEECALLQIYIIHFSADRGLETGKMSLQFSFGWNATALCCHLWLPPGESSLEFGPIVVTNYTILRQLSEALTIDTSVLSSVLGRGRASSSQSDRNVTGSTSLPTFRYLHPSTS